MALFDFAKFSAIAMISFAEAIRAERSSKALPITSSLFLRSSRSRRSRPEIPMFFRAGGIAAPDGVGSSGGARWSIHLRWMRAPLNRSRKIFSPPARKDNLVLSCGSSAFCIDADDAGEAGPGDSERRSCQRTGSGVGCGVDSLRGAPQISQDVMEVWFSKVHLGQMEACADLFGCGNCWANVPTSLGVSVRLAAKAALTRVTNGGVMPQVPHGASGVPSLAVAGSKFGGTGFEKEQIGQIHVALIAAGFGVRDSGLGLADTGAEMPSEWGGARCSCRNCLAAFGWRVTLGEDFRKPAYINSQLVCLNKKQGRLYINLASIDIFQQYSNCPVSRLIIVDVASPMRGQINLAVLVVCMFEVALVQPHLILDEEKCLIGK